MTAFARRSRGHLGVAVVVGLSALVLGGRAGHAGCTTSICVTDPYDSHVCTISADNVIDDGCTLTFSNTHVTITKPAKLRTGTQGHSFTLNAGRITLRGTLQAQGGTLAVNVTAGANTNGDFFADDTSNSPGKIDVRYGGAVTLVADGDVTLSGEEVDADGAGATDGGFVSVQGDSIDVDCPIDADGSTGGDGGSIELLATGNVSVDGMLTANGEGPLNGTSPADGGRTYVFAGGTLAVSNNLQVKGDEDGHGGTIELVSTGAATFDDNYNANGVGADGGASGGSITVDVASATITGDWSATGNFQGEGGTISVTARAGTLTFTNASSLDVSSGTQGGARAGSVDITGAGTVSVAGPITANSGGTRSEGGYITVTGGSNHTLTVSSVLEAKATTSSGERDGYIFLEACSVTLSGSLKTRNVNGGENVVRYRSSFTGTNSTLLTDDDGRNSIQCRCVDGSPADGACDLSPGATCVQNPTMTGATVTPSPVVTTPIPYPACG